MSSLPHYQALENNAYEGGLPLWMGKTSSFNPNSLCTVQPTNLFHFLVFFPLSEIILGILLIFISII